MKGLLSLGSKVDHYNFPFLLDASYAVCVIVVVAGVLELDLIH